MHNPIRKLYSVLMICVAPAEDNVHIYDNIFIGRYGHRNSIKAYFLSSEVEEGNMSESHVALSELTLLYAYETLVSSRQAEIDRHLHVLSQTDQGLDSYLQSIPFHY